MDKLKKIFSSILGIKESEIVFGLSPENTPSWDSLNALILITEIEKAFDIKFKFSEVMTVKNFSDAVDLIKSKGVNLND